MRPSLALILLLLSACAVTERSGSIYPGAERRFATCPGAAALSKAADVSWDAQPSMSAHHRELRARLNSPVPEGTTRILFWSSAIHHGSDRRSVIAVRDAQGRWRTSGVGEQGPGLLRIQPRALPPFDHSLPPEQGRALDRALADPCLAASPRFQRDADIPVGGASQTLEIETPGRRWIASWFGERSPQVQTVIGIIAK